MTDTKNKILKTQPLVFYYLQTKMMAVAKITLPENNKTFIASKYHLYLPSENQLIEEGKNEIKKLDANQQG